MTLLNYTTIVKFYVLEFLNINYMNDFWGQINEKIGYFDIKISHFNIFLIEYNKIYVT